MLKPQVKSKSLKIPSNSKELVFRLMTADKPFALIKIGDISGWLKNKLKDTRSTKVLKMKATSNG